MEKNNKQFTKISGYLEKKGKNIMRSSYKKYWFVLEGGLLLYYRSKDDYESISPCKGSINLGPPSIIKPCPSLVGVFQIQTRTVTVTLRAANLEEQNRWMEALIAEIQPNKTTQKMSHFRYSMGNLPKEQISDSTLETECSQEDIIHRLQKIGAQTYGKPTDIVRKDQIMLPNHTKKEDVEKRNSSKDGEHIYERISAEYAGDNKDIEDDAVKLLSNIPLQGFNTLKIKSEENRLKTYILENDVYAISIQEKEKKIDKSKNKSFIIENDTYASVGKNNEISRDLNENNVSKEEIMRNVEEENAYSIPFINDNSKNDVLYECIDRYNVEYAEPSEFKQPERTKKKKKKKEEEKVKDNSNNNKHFTNVKKRSSFINRMWKKKDKRKEKIQDDDKECIYETVPDTVVEKVCFTDDSTVKMLSELQNILEHKMPILMEKISNDVSSPTNKALTDIVPEEPPKKTRENNTASYPENPPAPKTHQQEFSSLFHDAPTNNKPIALPPKRKNANNFKNLDDILSELDSQQIDAKKNKVKKLIKKFSEPEIFENEVVLRNNKERNEIIREEGDSDELNRLLAELAKVTNAPMLLPGVTSSLNGNHIKDEELSKLLPVRQRRFSEPDYDIPRPHKSLTITRKKDEVSTNVIESTRFFGPILKPSGVVVPEETKNLEIPQLNSITPDSLETNVNQINSTIKRENIASNHTRKTSSKNVVKSECMIDNELYAEPRSIYNFQLSSEKSEHDDQDDEVFIDSLEVCKNEVSTEF